MSWFFRKEIPDCSLLPTLTMVKENLADNNARHLMLITEHVSALSLLFQCKIVAVDAAEVLIGSEFADDGNDGFLVAALNRVKDCMARGKTAVLVNYDAIYESLYDVMNLRTLKKKLKNGKVETMLRLAIGANSQLCPVDSRFKLVLICDSAEAYERLDVPLLSRFEKQVLNPSDCIAERTGQSLYWLMLRQWLEDVAGEIGEELAVILPGTVPLTNTESVAVSEVII